MPGLIDRFRVVASVAIDLVRTELELRYLTLCAQHTTRVLGMAYQMPPGESAIRVRFKYLRRMERLTKRIAFVRKQQNGLMGHFWDGV